MEKEQIIKALECCKNRGCQEGCPRLCNKIPMEDDCRLDLMKDALALIKELTEKVEAYRQELGKVRVALNNANADNKRLTEECERLKQLNESYAELEQGYIVTGVKKVQADTVWEFAERLEYTLCINNEENTEFFDYSYTLETIDEVANEILNKNTEEEKK